MERWLPVSRTAILCSAGAEEIRAISQNCTPQTCEVSCGGVHLMKPLLLHSSSKTLNQKHRRVIHLEFNRADLPNGLAFTGVRCQRTGFGAVRLLSHREIKTTAYRLR